MSFCVVLNKKVDVTSEKIFFALPGIALGFGLGEFIGKVNPIGHIATVLLIVSSIFAALGVIVPPRLNYLKWFVFILLIGNIVSSVVYLIIIATTDYSQPLGNARNNGEVLNVELASNITVGQNATLSSNSDETKSQLPGLKSPIALLTLGILLLANFTLSYRIDILKDDIAEDGGVSFSPEQKPLGTQEAETNGTDGDATS